MTSFYASDIDRMEAQKLLINELAKEKKIPKLSDVLKTLKEALKEAGVTEWESTIETYLEVSSGTIIPGGKAGVKTTIKLSGKT